MGEAVELWRRHNEAWNDGDLTRLAGLFDPDVVVRPDPGWPDSRVSHGLADAAAWFHQIYDGLGGGEVTTLEETDLADRALVRLRVQAVASAEGLEAHAEYAALVTARDGRIAMLEYFFDYERALKLVGR